MAEERIGIVREIWRYPVKSMGGESIARCTLGPLGVPGDRGWAVRDEQAAEIRGGKKLPALMRCTARYREEPRDDRVPHADVTLPDGTATATDAPDVAARLASLLGRAVTLWPRRPADDDQHYRRGLPDQPDMLAELREIFGRTEDEPLPDLAQFPTEIMEYTSPRGTYFDVFPLHVLTTASLAALGAPERFDRRRFRPNVLVETSAGLEGLVEAQWAGRRLRIGDATVTAEMPTVRCSMVMRAQPGLDEDASVLRRIVRAADQNLGLYASVAGSGAIAVGDPVVLL